MTSVDGETEVDSNIELERFWTWRGSTVRYGRFGEGPPVVLCHGTPWSSFVWRSVIDALRESWTVYAWDMVGYGQSDKPDGDVSLRAQGELLTALVEHWEIDSPHVVAHDFGGAVALRAHLIHHVAFSSLALVDVVALRPWGSPFFKLVADNADVFTELPSNIHEAVVREYIAGASSPGLRPEVLDRLVNPWLGQGQAAFYRQIAQADERHTAEFEPLLEQVAVPTLIVWGADDQWIPVDRVQRLESAIPGSISKVIDGAGHLIQEDAPAALTVTVDRWLAGQRLRRETGQGHSSITGRAKGDVK